MSHPVQKPQKGKSYNVLVKENLRINIMNERLYMNKKLSFIKDVPMPLYEIDMEIEKLIAMSEDAGMSYEDIKDTFDALKYE